MSVAVALTLAIHLPRAENEKAGERPAFSCDVTR